jgi:subtilase family serine protease
MPFNNVQVWISVDRIEELAQWEEIRAIRLPITEAPMGISSEGLSLTIGNITSWRSNGVKGQNVKVGVIDLGFSGGENLLGTEIPSNTSANYTGSIADFNSTEHGTACAEIIHDVAPESDLYLVNSSNASVGFSLSLNWLKEQTVHIISSSIALNNLLMCKYIYETMQYSGFSQLYALSQLEGLSNLILKACAKKAVLPVNAYQH